MSFLISHFLWRGTVVSRDGITTRWLLLAGADFFEVADGSPKHFTIVFNAFVFCQVTKKRHQEFSGRVRAVVVVRNELGVHGPPEPSLVLVPFLFLFLFIFFFFCCLCVCVCVFFSYVFCCLFRLRVFCSQVVVVSIWCCSL